MSRTRTELIVEVLDQLGKSEAGQDPAAEDAAKVDGKIKGMLEYLARRKIVYVADPNSIDDAIFESISVILASRCGPAFGAGRQRDVEREEEANLRLLQPRPGGYPVLRNDYF